MHTHLILMVSIPFFVVFLSDVSVVAVVLLVSLLWLCFFFWLFSSLHLCFYEFVDQVPTTTTNETTTNKRFNFEGYTRGEDTRGQEDIRRGEKKTETGEAYCMC